MSTVGFTESQSGITISEMDGNGRKRTFVATEKDSLDTETDSLGTETDRNGPKRTFSDEFAWANFSLNSSKFQSERAERIKV